MNKGRSIRLFLVDGIPGGIITAEIMNWTGHVMVAPRSRLADLIQRPESSRTGIYFLTGIDPEGTLAPLVYVGETDNVGKRLAQHNRDESKEFWDRAVLITSKDQNLTKAHVRYLEARLIAIMTEAGQAKVLNSTAPEYGLLPEGDSADMEFFIEQVRIILPVLGLDFLREPPRLPHGSMVLASCDGASQTPFPMFEIHSKKHELHAEAQEIDGDFVVLKGSQARKEWCGGENHHYRELYLHVIKAGILAATDEGILTFQQDYSFRSPSAAAAVIFGRASNGRREWYVKGSRKTYAEWQEEQVAVASLPTDM